MTNLSDERMADRPPSDIDQSVQRRTVSEQLVSYIFYILTRIKTIHSICSLTDYGLVQLQKTTSEAECSAVTPSAKTMDRSW